MTKTEYVEYIASEHWQQRRVEAIEFSGSRCARCGLPRWAASVIYDQDLHVHHKNYQHLGDEWLRDLEVLCRRCHEIETFGRSDFKGLKSVHCSLCGASHFGIYSDYCDVCRIAFYKDGDGSLDANLQIKDHDDKPLWHVLMLRIVHELHYSGRFSMVDFLAVIVEGLRLPRYW